MVEDHRGDTYRVVYKVRFAKAVYVLHKTTLEANPQVAQYWASYAYGLLRTRQADSARKIVHQAGQRGHAGPALQQIDVLLDTVHFGSGTSFYETMYHGTPVVTWPGPFMRGRIVAGGYQQMGLAEAAPIANKIGEYAPLAVQWANDPTPPASLSPTRLGGA